MSVLETGDQMMNCGLVISEYASSDGAGSALLKNYKIYETDGKKHKVWFHLMEYIW